MPDHSPDVPQPASEPVQSDVVVAVLAAGHGTRMRSDIPKHLHPIAGIPIVERIIRAGIRSGAGRTIVMVGSNLADLEQRVGSRGEWDLIVQGPPRGTADSVRLALEQAPEARWLVSLLGDGALLTADVVRSLIEQAQSTGSRLTLLTCRVPDAATYGRIERDDEGRIRRIVEFKNDTPDKRLGEIEINSNAMVLDAEWARRELATLPIDEATGEFLLTDLVDVAVRQATQGGDWPVDAFVADASIALAVNDRVQLAEVDTHARQIIRERHMRAGVTIIGPETVFIDEDVEIGRDTVIHPHTILRGATVVGSNCEIGPSALIEDARIGDAVTVSQSTVRSSTIGDGSDVGPYAHLRGGCRIGRHVHIGSYVEMKNAVIADEAKCGHVSYLGDVTVGAGTNIGAGTVTANFDGNGKHPTVIGENAFIGSDSVLVAPVSVGDGAKTGAGSVVTHDVPDNTLVLGVPARPRQAVDATDSRGSDGE